MSSLESIKSSLKPLGIYYLDGESFLNIELSTYALELDRLNNAIEELEQECFVSTSNSYGLDSRERLCGYLRQSWEANKRRKKLMHIISIKPTDYTKERIEYALQCCGVNTSISEDTANGNIYINCIDTNEVFESRDNTQNEAKRVLPAHLSYTFDFRDINWANIDEHQKTFDEMDNANMMWNEIEVYERG